MFLVLVRRILENGPNVIRVTIIIHIFFELFLIDKLLSINSFSAMNRDIIAKLYPGRKKRLRGHFIPLMYNKNTIMNPTKKENEIVKLKYFNTDNSFFETEYHLNSRAKLLRQKIKKIMPKIGKNIILIPSQNSTSVITNNFRNACYDSPSNFNE